MRNSSAGFTLLELTLLLVIMGIFVGVAAPAWRGFRDDLLLRGACRNAVALARLAQGMAVARGVPVRLNYDLDQGLLWVSEVEETGEGLSQDGAESGAMATPAEADSVLPGGEARALPPGVFLRQVRWTTAAGETEAVATGTTATLFVPDGRATETWVELADRRGHSYTVYLEPQTGRPEVYQGEETGKESGGG